MMEDQGFLDREQFVLDHLTSDAYRRLRFMSVAHRELYLRVIEALYEYIIYRRISKIDTEDLRAVVKAVRGIQTQTKRWGRKVA